jgi:hypothetical protein
MRERSTQSGPIAAGNESSRPAPGSKVDADRPPADRTAAISAWVKVSDVVPAIARLQAANRFSGRRP